MSSSTKPPRIIIVSFDGLRTDLIRPETTPNLVRLQRHGIALSRHRTVYPSETRSAMPSLVTGAWPDGHGMVGNAYLDRSVAPPRYANTSDDKLVEALDHLSGGRLMGAVSLGETLAAHGRTLAVLASNSPGTTRLFHHKARALGHLSINGHLRSAATSQPALDDFERRFGKLPPEPPKGTPDLEAQTFLTSALLGAVWTEQKPDVAILSFGEPDISSHYCGTADALTLQALAWTDHEFGRVLDWFESEGKAQGVQLIAVSDHGHITVHRQANVREVLEGAGFNCGAAMEPHVDALLMPGQVGAIYLADPSEKNIGRAVAAMIETPWCGPVFTRGRNEIEGIAAGTFARSLVHMDHDRAADILFSYRSNDGVDPFGLMGRTWSNGWPVGLGVHGGLHPKEMEAVCILAGDAFKTDARSDVPSGICDIAPTVLQLLGIKMPGSMQGRVLAEALSSSHHATPPSVSETLHEVKAEAYSQYLRRFHVDNATYVDAAWV